MEFSQHRSQLGRSWSPSWARGVARELDSSDSQVQASSVRALNYFAVCFGSPICCSSSPVLVHLILSEPALLARIWHVLR
eukprot:354793-Pyramimonas_sp.AAC.1